MRILLFGASGMIGQGVLLQALADPGVTQVTAVVRRPLGKEHPKLREVIHRDFEDYRAIAEVFAQTDACLFCLGVSSAGMAEAAYRTITQGYTLAAARQLVVGNPAAAFAYISGMSSDEHGRAMWARVKGETERDLLASGLPHVYLFRPGYIQPVQGEVSATRLYRMAYASLGWLYPVLSRVAPNVVTTTVTLAQAMLRAVRERGPSRVIEMAAINELGR
jgi:uncharacterized protein YbjT (DUF2867 family)